MRSGSPEGSATFNKHLKSGQSRAERKDSFGAVSLGREDKGHGARVSRRVPRDEFEER